MRSDEAKTGSAAAKLHRAGEDYLKTILALQMAYGGVRSADVAKELNVSKAGVFFILHVGRSRGSTTDNTGELRCYQTSADDLLADPGGPILVSIR